MSWALLAAPLLVAVPGCASRSEDPPAAADNLTPGMVKMKIVKGQTRQAELLEVFGPPDQVAHKDGQDVWTYDKSSYEYDKRSDYFTLLIAGSGGDRVRSSSRTTMLIPYFDKNEVVQDYRLTATRF
jgi:hypothetical protein